MAENFAPLPDKGEKGVQKVLKKVGLFRYLTPDEVVEEELKSLSALPETKLLTKRKVFCRRFHKQADRFVAGQWSGKNQGWCWNDGYWGIFLVREHFWTGRKYLFALACHVGQEWHYDPETCRERVTKDLGDEFGEKWWKRQLEELDSLRWCLNQACKHLQEDNSLAFCEVHSTTSETLFRQLEVRVEHGLAFLFPANTF